MPRTRPTWACSARVTVGSLLKHGYNVLTWDPRWFGKSTGTVEIDSAAFEGRDVEEMIDWIATQPGVELDGPRDPRVGMTGASYGGGIQLVVAAIDCRVDAIVPTIAWHSLTTSLFKADTPKNGWSGLLIAATAGRAVDPHITDSYKASTTSEIISPADRAFFADRGPGDLVSRITAPTLIVQGTVDNLFTLDEGITNYRILRGRGVPTAMLWFCGGHGVCLTNPGDPTRVGNASLAWLDRYLKRDTSVATGSRFDFVDQNGVRYTAVDYPLPAGTPVTARRGHASSRRRRRFGTGAPRGRQQGPTGRHRRIDHPGAGDERRRPDTHVRQARRHRRRADTHALVQGHHARGTAPDVGVRAARRRYDRHRRRQSGHTDRRRPRREGPQGLGSARSHRVQRSRGGACRHCKSSRRPSRTRRRDSAAP